MEWLRSWLFTGFTWLSPADTLVNFGFAPILPITGTLGPSYLFYTLTALLLYALLEKKLKVSLLFLASLLGTTLLLWSLQKISYTKPINKKIYTQIIQSHFTKKENSKRYKIIKRVKHFQKLALQEPQAELSVWSESTMSVEYKNVKRHLKNGFEKLRKNNVEVLYGSYVNSKNILMQNSNEKVAYSKQHLMPFGEYTPTWLVAFKTLLPNLENSNLKSSINVRNIDLNGTILAPSICYELLFPDELRTLSSKANVLVHISNLGWFDHTWAQSYFLNLAKMRSLEHGKPMIYVVNAGNSAFILPNGKIEKVSNSTKGTQALYNHVQPYEGQTPYAIYGNKPILYLLMLLLGIYLLIGGGRDVLKK